MNERESKFQVPACALGCLEIAEARIENAILTYEYGLVVEDTEIEIEGNDEDSGAHS